MTPNVRKPPAPPPLTLPPIDPMALIREAVAARLDPDAIRTLFELQRTYTRDQAAAAFGHSFAAFQAECPPVVKTRQADRYKFAGFEEVMTTIGPTLAKHKLSVSVAGPSGKVKDAYDLDVRVQHGLHFVDSHYEYPMPSTVEMAKAQRISETQAIGTIASYYRRYAVCQALNIVVIGEDTDARLNPEGCTDTQVSEINGLAEQCREAGAEVDWGRLFEVYGIDPHDGLNAASQIDAAKIIATLKQKLKAAQKGGAK